MKILVLFLTLLVASCAIHPAQSKDGSDAPEKKEMAEYTDGIKIVKYKRRWFKERLFMLYVNVTRIFTLHQPLIGIGTPRMQKGAYLQALDMAQKDYCSHRNFGSRSRDYHFRGENVAMGYQSAFDFYKGWMQSRGHRENLMDWAYFFTGIGMCDKVVIMKTYDDEGKLILKKRYVDSYAAHVFK